MSKLLVSLFAVAIFVVFPQTVFGTAWDVTTASYSSISTSTSPANSPDGMFVRADGLKVYISNFSDSKIYQFSLGSAFDLTTLSYDSKSFTTSSQGTPDDVAFSSDGTKMFMLSFYDYSIRQYTLSTPWDVSTASYDSVSLALGSANHYDFHFKRDGTKFFSLNDFSNRVQQYTLNSANSISSVTAGTNYSYPTFSDGQELVFAMGDNGSNMYIGTATSKRLHWLTLSSAWDTSTASYANKYFSMSSQDSSPRKVFFASDGSYFWMLGNATHKLYKYTLGDDTAPTISSISSDKADGSYKAGEVIDIDVTFSEAVTSTGNVTVTLETGSTDQTCTFTVSNSTTGTCNYTVQVGDDSADLSATITGTIADQSSNALSNFTPTTSLYTNKNLIIDNTSPTVSVTTPASSATVAGTTVSLTSSASDNRTVAGVKFYIDDVLQGAEDISSPYSITWDSTGSSNSSHSIVAVARDIAGNVATSSPVTFTIDNTTPGFSSLAVTATSTGATATWTSSSLTSSKVNYGITTDLGQSTSETDTGTRVLSHSVDIYNLVPCSKYYYQIQGTNAVSVTATSSIASFVTLGCAAESSISATTDDNIQVSTGGTLAGGNLTLTVPTGFTTASSSAAFQIHTLDNSTFFGTVNVPSGKTQAGNTIYELRALIDATTSITTFAAALQVTLSYSDSDISSANLEEASLVIYRYDGSSWHALTNCSVDTIANTVTCDTQNFSDFTLFGDGIAAADSDESSTERRSSGVDSIQSRLKNLLVMGKINEAAALKSAWPRLFAQSFDGGEPQQQSLTTQQTSLVAISANTEQVNLPVNKKFDEDLSIGATGEKVIALQMFLIEQNKGPSALELQRVGATGYFGNYTKNALGEFQKSKGIIPWNGYFGTVTRFTINSMWSR